LGFFIFCAKRKENPDKNLFLARSFPAPLCELWWTSQSLEVAEVPFGPIAEVMSNRVLGFGKAFAIITAMENTSLHWTDKQYSHISGRIIKHAMDIHTFLGPGLLEHVYEQCLADELRYNGLRVETQVNIPICFKGRRIESGYRGDILVEDKILVELKSVQKILQVHEFQVLTYIRLGGFKLGLLINFNETRLKNGLRRFANEI